MKHASLFSGIGGFDLAAEWMGWENVLQCEIDDFCMDILRYYWPCATHYGNIRDIDGTEWKGKIDIITGGFPCQPFSSAGKRGGEEDNRFLWPEMLRIIQEVQPTWVIAENVRGIITIDNGMVLERVRFELEESGYECQPILIPACSVGAPHRRDRIWFIAHRNSEGLEKSGQTGNKQLQKKGGKGLDNRFEQQNSNVTNTNKWRQQRKRLPIQRRRQEQGKNNDVAGCYWSEGWVQAATRLCSVDDGFPRRLDGITVPSWRRQSIKAYGNAIVPQIAFQILNSIPNA